MKSFLEALAASLLAVFAPVKAALVTILVLVAIDLITGIWVSVKNKQQITSAGLKRTIIKLFVYEAAMCLAFLVHQYLTGDTFPADKIVAAMVGLTELKSCVENLQLISGDPLLATLIAKIDTKENKT